MSEKQLILNSLKTILNEEYKNPLFMELDVLLLKNDVNLNGYYFTEGFIDEIVNNQSKYEGLPLVVDLEKLMSQDYLNLGHNYSPFVDKFYSQQIGSYVSFEKKLGEDGVAELHGKARISKRNTDLINVLMELYTSPIGLNFSVEVFASDYNYNDKNWLIIDASQENYLVSDCLVSFPAEPSSQALKLVAELNRSLQGGEKENMSKKDILSELSHSDIRSQLSNLLNPTFDADGWRIYDYWIVNVYDNYCIVSDEKKAGVYYKFQYTKNEKDEITLGEKSQVTIQFVSVNSKGGVTNMENVNIDVNELVKAKEGLVLENEQLKQQLETLTTEKADLEVKLNEANETVVSLGKDKETLTAQVEELTAFKSEIVEKEVTAKIEALINEVKEDLNQEELTLVNEVAETKDVEKVQFKINELCAKKYKETIKLNNSTEDNFFSAPKQKDLGSDELSKFNM